MPQYIGLAAATVTPMYDDGTINYDIIPKFIDHLISTGVETVFLNGTTGEWSSLSVEEGKLIVDVWLEHGRAKLAKLIVHCGALSIVDAKTLAQHAASKGADAVACISPSFLKPENEECLVDYLSDVSSAAPNTQFFYYHIPSLTNVNINMPLFLSLAYHKIPTFSGLKVSTQDFHEVYQCLAFKEKELEIFYGVDNQFFAALVMGVKAAVGSFYNFLGKQFNEIIDEFNKGNLVEARNKQIKISLDILSLYKKHGVAITKPLTSLISGLDMGPNRTPLKTHFSDDEMRDLKIFLYESGYLSSDLTH